MVQQNGSLAERLAQPRPTADQHLRPRRRQVVCVHIDGGTPTGHHHRHHLNPR